MRLTNGALLCMVLWANDRANAQDWALIGLRNYFLEVKQVYADTEHNDLYVVGATSYLPDTGISFYRLHDQQWDTLGLFDQDLYSTIVWHDTLIVTGAFFSVNGESIEHIAYWAQDHWAPYGSLSTGGIHHLKVLNGELYALGSGLGTIDGQPWHGIAKRVGNHWQPLPLMAGLSDVGIEDIAFFNGHLIAAGNIHFVGNPYRDIMMLNDDSTWSPVGPQGLLGFAAYVSSCIVYQGDLYACGGISVLDGNAGEGIMRWDGNQWHDVGGGIRYSMDSFGITCTVTHMQEHNGLLFVSSGCSYAGGVPAGGMATWDGTHWCGLGDPIPIGCMTFDFLNDTLYANAIYWQPNVQNTVVKYMRSDYADTCSVPTGVEELQREPKPFAAWLDGSGQLMLSGLPNGGNCVTIHDSSGRELARKSIVVSSNRASILWPPGLSAGCYIARSSTGQSIKLASIP